MDQEGSEQMGKVKTIENVCSDDHKPTIIQKIYNNPLNDSVIKYEQQRQEIQKRKNEMFKIVSNSIQANIDIKLINEEGQIHQNGGCFSQQEKLTFEKEAQQILQRMKTKQSSFNCDILNEDQRELNNENINKIQTFNKKGMLNKKSRPRKGLTTQSYAQKIWKQNTNSHIHKNLESKIRTVLKNGLKRISHEKSQLLENKKNLNQKQLNEFIKNSGLSRDQWQKVLDLPSIYMQINHPNSKLGTSSLFRDKPPELKKFLQNLGKKILKIIIRSVRRMIFKCLLSGQEIVQYLDEQASRELHGLDDFCLQYKSIVFSTLIQIANEHNLGLNEQEQQNTKTSKRNKFNYLIQSKDDIKKENLKNNAHWEVKLADIQEELQSEKSSIQEQKHSNAIEKQSQSILQFEAFILPYQLKNTSSPHPFQSPIHLSDSKVSANSYNLNKKTNFPLNQKGEKNLQIEKNDSFQVIDKCQGQ